MISSFSRSTAAKGAPRSNAKPSTATRTEHLKPCDLISLNCFGFCLLPHLLKKMFKSKPQNSKRLGPSHHCSKSSTRPFSHSSSGSCREPAGSRCRCPARSLDASTRRECTRRTDKGAMALVQAEEKSLVKVARFLEMLAMSVYCWRS